MDIYLVGGAVRDTLLGLPVKDRDWVVVGVSPQHMVALGYVAVGKDFPVFLHPVSKEEYALARTERNSAPGYKGFTVHAAPDVTLEQDLARRDLTINAIAVSSDQLDDNGNFDPRSALLDDPFHGRRDLQQRCLRHVTDAFHDDPVRILRLARFAARFADFRVADETLALMRSMVANGDVDALVAERVWQELARGLLEDTPSRMLQELDACGALSQLLPELRPIDKQSAIGAGDGLAVTLDRAAAARAPLTVRFACLGLFIDGEAPLRQVCERLRAPNDCRGLALLSMRERDAVRDRDALDAAGLVQLLERCDAFRKPARFAELLQVCAIGATQDRANGVGKVRASDLMAVLSAAQSVSTDTIARREMAAGRSGPQIGAAIHAARVAAIDAMQQPGPM